MVIITAYQSQKDNKHVELFRPTVVPCGAKEVDNEFLKLVIEIFGVDTWQKFEKTNTNDCLETRKRLEDQRREVGLRNVKKVKIRFPQALLEEYTMKTASEFQSEKGVTKVGDKIVFPIQVLLALFDKPANAINRHVEQLLNKTELEGLRTIFMTGSFSDSPLLYKNVQSRFPAYNILRPRVSLLSVSKGAVISGFLLRS